MNEEPAVSKAFDNHPKVRGRMYSVIVSQNDKTATYKPKTMIVRSAGKTLLLRRPKYNYEIIPDLPKKPPPANSQVYLRRSMVTKPDPSTARGVHQLVTQGKKKGKVNGMSVEVHKSAFSKAAKKKPPTAGRVLTGALFPGFHGAVAGKKGHKLRAVGYELGGEVAGSVVGLPPVGAGVGTYLAHKQGHYKVQKNLSAFGVEHPESIAKAENPRQLMTLQRIAGMKVKGVPQAAKNSPRVAAAFDRANKVRPFNNKPADKINRAMARLTGVPGRNGRMAG